MKMTKILMTCLVATFLCACSSNAVPLSYNPSLKASAATVKVKPVISPVGTVVDRRGHDANWLGAIRGGFGNPIKTLTTQKPVSQEIKDLLNEGLKARGLLAASKPRYEMKVTMVQFDCNQYARLEAHATLEVDVLEIASGRSVYSKSYTADKVDGSVVTLNAGIFGSVDDLKKVANDTIQDVIDQIVTDSALLAKLK